LSWPQLLKSRRILLIAETGTGKTNECKAQAKLLFEDVRLHFFCASRMWWQQTYVCAFMETTKRASMTGETLRRRLATFFLDSIDEPQLAHANFRDALGHLGHDGLRPKVRN